MKVSCLRSQGSAIILTSTVFLRGLL